MGTRMIKTGLSLLGAALTSGAASSQELTLTPLVDVRLRWEQVDQAGLPREAEAITARARVGLNAARGPLSALVETEATLAIDPAYNSGTNGRAAYPVVADPQNVELNRAQLRYARGGVTATAGRQLGELADQRFVGSASWRQNQQTYDAARLQLGQPGRLFADVTYAWSVRTVNGINGAGARPGTIGGDNIFALAGARTPAGLATGFAYLVDQDHDGQGAPVQDHRLSSRTYGVRLAGARRLGRGVSLAYAGSWARQGGRNRNPNRYAATYWLAEASATAGRATVTGGQEVLGADDGRALTSVQTPLASLFKFQGWADKFTTTPPNGVRDLYAGASLGWKKVGALGNVGLSATWHRFRSDRLDQRYGTEWDLLASARRGRTTGSVRVARYRAEGFATDTDKLWVELDWLL